MNSLAVHHSVKIELILYPRHEQLKKEVYDFLFQHKDKQRLRSSTGKFFSLTEWNLKFPEIEELKDYIVNFLKHLPSSLRWGSAGDFKFENLWVNVYKHGEYTTSHGHTEDLTMVYFLTDEAEHAPLLLDDSKTPIYPKEGLMALFPAYVYHSVPKHMSNHERITLSGDIRRIKD